MNDFTLINLLKKGRLTIRKDVACDDTFVPVGCVESTPFTINIVSTGSTPPFAAIGVIAEGSPFTAQVPYGTYQVTETPVLGYSPNFGGVINATVPGSADWTFVNTFMGYN